MKLVEIEPKSRQAKKCLEMHVKLFGFKHRVSFDDKLQRKLWPSGRVLGSRTEGRGFDPCPMLDGSGVKAMPGLISTPNSGSLKKNKKIQVAKWGTPKKKYLSFDDNMAIHGQPLTTLQV